jgi:tetratricopeptide (TPR) repeat protein
MKQMMTLLKRFLPLLALVPFVVAAQDSWVVKSAAVRVDVSVGTEPDDPDLGVFVKIPDGGLLPGPVPQPEAYDGAGKPLQSVIVGYNKQDGLGVLFAPPSDGKASIYISGVARANPPANCKLVPSVLMFTRNGRASLEGAVKMAKPYPPAPGAFFGVWPCIGSMVNPYGPDDDFVTWYVGAIKLDKAEDIYFATVSDEGSEFSIDGRKVAEWPGIHTRGKGAKGQHGAHIKLEAGLHRIDYFHFEVKGAQESQLVWKRRGMETKDNLPELVSGFAKSGEGRIVSIQMKDGRVCGTLEGLDKPLGYLWTGEKPLNIFSLAAVGVPADGKATVVMDFGKGQRSVGPSVEWLVSGDPDTMAVPVTLEVSNAVGVARTAMRLMCPWTPTEMSLDKAPDRLHFRTAFFGMLKAVPPPADPCAGWDRDHWQMLGELLEPYRSGPILMELFNRGFATLQKLPPAERWALEDRFVETLRLARNDKLLLDWIDRLENNEHTGARKFRWRDERVCAYLLDIGQPDQAKRLLNALKDSATTADQSQVAVLRQGDVAYALGDTEAAMGFYKDAEERYRARNKTGMAGGRLSFVGPRKARAPKAEETNTVANAKGKKPVPAPAPAPKSPPPPSRIDDWKVYTVHDSSMYTTITSDISQDALPEAFQKLSDWENESPTSKLSGEYPMAAARLYLYVKDYRRAVNELDIYRKSVTMSAQLADVMKLEISALEELKDTKRAKEIAQEFLKRFPGHPYEAEMKEHVAE